MSESTEAKASSLERIAKDLKDRVSEFEPDEFARQMTSFIHGITLPWNASVMKGLISPFRQLFYLFNLNITSAPQPSYPKAFDQNKDWPALVTLLNQMEEIHKYEYGELKPFAAELFNELEPDEVIRRRQIGSSTYASFFHQGPLHYEEQSIEKICELYKNFDDELRSTFGWNSTDVIAIYDRLDALRQAIQDKAFLKQPRKEPNKEEFMERFKTAFAAENDFGKAMIAAADMPTGMFEYTADPSSVNVFSVTDLNDCSQSLSDLLLNELTVSRSADDSYLYFSQPNQLYKKPIYRLGDGNYLVTDHRVLLTALSSVLQTKCSELTTNKNRITQARDKFLERKLEALFRDFYQHNTKANIIPSYYLKKGDSERDLLILEDKTVLIIEAKAGKIREPMYDPDKAYNGIWQDFKDTIDYGYIQAHSVKKKFLDKTPFDIYDKKKTVILTIDPRHYKYIYTIIVTYNKFGQVECDLQLMLDLFDNDQFPWATGIDDLEIFLLGLKKMKLNEKDFYRFLEQRENLHGQLIVNDEGRVTGHFLKNKRILPQRGVYHFTPDDDYIYDELYSTGLGFKNERGMDRKQDPRFHKIV